MALSTMACARSLTASFASATLPIAITAAIAVKKILFIITSEKVFKTPYPPRLFGGISAIFAMIIVVQVFNLHVQTESLHYNLIRRRNLLFAHIFPMQIAENRPVFLAPLCAIPKHNLVPLPQFHRRPVVSIILRPQAGEKRAGPPHPHHH